MADISDVFDALSEVIAGVIYPNGPSQPSAIIVNGAPVPFLVHPGWPLPGTTDPGQLDYDLAHGTGHVSLYAPAGFWRNTTRYPLDWVVTAQPVHWLSTAIDATGTHLTLGGTVPVPFVLQNLGVLCNGNGVAYEVLPSDTLTSIAAAMAALITASITPATSAGPVVTIPAARFLRARVGGTGTAIQEVMRERQRFQVTFWCPIADGPAAPDAIRRAVSAPVKVVLAALNFLDLADGTAGRINVANDYLNDDPQKTQLLRRDLFCDVEYGSTVQMVATQIVVQKTVISGGTQLNGPVIGTFFS